VIWLKSMVGVDYGFATSHKMLATLPSGMAERRSGASIIPKRDTDNSPHYNEICIRLVGQGV
jgi:hypothetical protein